MAEANDPEGVTPTGEDGPFPSEPPPPPPAFAERPEGETPAPAGLALARPRSRVGAALIDMVPLVFAAWALGDRETERDLAFSIQLENGALVLWLLIVVAYSAVIEIGGRSIGKAVLRLRVVDEVTGEPPSPGQIVRRSVARLVDSFPFLYLVAFVAVVNDPERRRIGDRWAKTRVVVERPAGPFITRAAIASVTGLLVIAGSLAVVANDPGLQLGAFDYDEEVVPFAREYAALVLDGDEEAAIAAIQWDLLGTTPPAGGVIDQMLSELDNAPRTGEVIQREAGVLLGHPTVDVFFAVDRPGKALVVSVMDRDGTLAIIGVHVAFQR